MTLLEIDVTALQDEVEEVETDNTLQDERLNIIDEAVNQNGNEIDGKITLTTEYSNSSSVRYCEIL